MKSYKSYGKIYIIHSEHYEKKIYNISFCLVNIILIL